MLTSVFILDLPSLRLLRLHAWLSTLNSAEECLLAGKACLFLVDPTICVLKKLGNNAKLA